MKRIALTGRTPYVGTTTIGRHLQLTHHYKHICMSDILIEQFSMYIQAKSQGVITPNPDEMYKNKELYRRQLSVYAQTMEPTFLRGLLGVIELYPITHLIVEKVRTDTQAIALLNIGFTLYRIERPMAHVMNKAKEHGHSPETWNALELSGANGYVSDAYITETFNNNFTADTLASILSEL